MKACRGWCSAVRPPPNASLALKNMENCPPEDLLLKDEAYHSDWLLYLKESNLEAQEIPHGVIPHLILPTNVVELVFQLCTEYQEPDEVRYLTLEIFDRFMYTHYSELLKRVKDTTCNEKSFKDTWNRTCARVHGQSLLRILTSFQIASKWVLNATEFSTTDIHKLLRNCGHGYKRSSILQSEQRILHTLDFKVPRLTIFTYLETLLEAVVNSSSNLAQYYSKLFELSIKILDAVKLYHEEVYLRFYYFGTGRWERTLQEREEFVKVVETNNMLLGCAVILTAISIKEKLPDGLPNPLSTKSIMKLLGWISDIEPDEILSLAITIVQVIIGPEAKIL